METVSRKIHITCDRCGKTIKCYTERDRSAYWEYKDRLGAMKVNRRAIFPDGEKTSHFFDIDLCDECETSFRTWYEGGK